MNILILTLGSRGDVQPYVALGQGLQKAGHSVTICTSSSFESFITDSGLQYAYMNNELLDLVDTDAGREAMETTTNALSWFSAAIKLAKEVKPLQRKMLVECWQAAQETEPDVIIFHPKAFGGPHIAEKLNVPVISAVALPVLVPTAEFPNIVFPTWKLGGWYNRLTYTLALKGARGQYGGLIKEFRQSLGLPKQARSADDLHTTAGDFIPTLHGYSKHVAPQPTDWPAGAVATGYWFLNSPANWRPPVELQSFLSAGEPPVYIGFGSMAGRNPKRTAEIVVSALKQAGVRGIIATGWGGLKADDLPDSILKIEGAPHDWLFPKMAAVVHHGGAGTTAAGLRAGKPTIICPFFADQPFWGRRVFELGVGPQPIPQKKLTAETLAEAIRIAVNDTAMSEKAVALGQKIEAENGIGNAIAIIEKIVTEKG